MTKVIGFSVPLLEQWNTFFALISVSASCPHHPNTQIKRFREMFSWDCQLGNCTRMRLGAQRVAVFSAHFLTTYVLASLSKIAIELQKRSRFRLVIFRIEIAG